MQVTQRRLKPIEVDRGEKKRKDHPLYADKPKEEVAKQTVSSCSLNLPLLRHFVPPPNFPSVGLASV